MFDKEFCSFIDGPDKRDWDGHVTGRILVEEEEVGGDGRSVLGFAEFKEYSFKIFTLGVERKESWIVSLWAAVGGGLGRE